MQLINELFSTKYLVSIEKAFNVTFTVLQYAGL